MAAMNEPAPASRPWPLPQHPAASSAALRRAFRALARDTRSCGRPPLPISMTIARYRFGDYAKVGIPLIVVMLIVVLIFVPIFWPFYPG